MTKTSLRWLGASLALLLIAGLLVFMQTLGWDLILGKNQSATSTRDSISLKEVLGRMPADIRSALKAPGPGLVARRDANS
jgi:hypothetical protein